MWAELLPDCKTPLFELNFLEELWGICPDNLEAGGWSLTRHWQQFVLIQAEVEVLIARRQSLLQLSDTLEGHLGLWLKRFTDILEKLDEKKRCLIQVVGSLFRVIYCLLAVCLACWFAGDCRRCPRPVQDFGRLSIPPTCLSAHGNSLPFDAARGDFTPDHDHFHGIFGRPASRRLEPLVYAELEKSKRFEVILVTRQQMKQWTGQKLWRTDEQLPPDFFERICAGHRLRCSPILPIDPFSALSTIGRGLEVQPSAKPSKSTVVALRAHKSSGPPMKCSSRANPTSPPGPGTIIRNIFVMRRLRRIPRPCSVRPPASANTPWGRFSPRSRSGSRSTNDR